MDVTSFDSTPTFFGVLEEVRNERFLGLLHQLDNTFLDGIFVLVEPAVDVVLDLETVQQYSRIQFISLTALK